MEKETKDMSIGEMFGELGRGLLNFGRHYAANFDIINRNPEYPRLPRDTPLFINCNPYSIKRTRKDGEKDLVKLAHEVPYEGSWFYTPKDSYWYHVSERHEEEFGDEGKYQFSSIQRKGSFNLPSKEIVHYHTHPKRANDHMTDFLMNRFKEEKQKCGEDLVNKFLDAGMYLYSVFPSVEDIKTYTKLTQDFMNQSGVSFYGRVASPIGITNVNILDQNESVEKYEEIKKGLFNMISEGNYVQFKKIEDQSTISISAEDLFDDFNKRLEGKLKLDFELIDCGIEL